MAAGVTDRLWEISDIVKVLEDHEAQVSAEPVFHVHASQIESGYLVRALFPNGDSEDIRGFATRDDAINWIRCEAIVWLYQRREKEKRIASQQFSNGLHRGRHERENPTYRIGQKHEWEWI